MSTSDVEVGGASPAAGPRGIGGAPPASAGMAAIELPKKAADAVEVVVDAIHDKAIRPAALIARAVVFGLLVAALATLMVVMVSIVAIRVLDNYLFSTEVWVSYAIVGGLLTLMGLGAWSLRGSRTRTSRG